MNDGFKMQAGQRGTGSMGVKLIVVCALALVMTIPALFVEGLVSDRTGRASEVTRQVSGLVGGQQTFLGPTLAIPFTIAPKNAGDSAVHGTYVIFPTQARANATVQTEERRRSLFKVPVFQADLVLESQFDLAGVKDAVPPEMVLDWAGAECVVGVSDARGALADATLTRDGQTVTLAPAAVSQTLTMNTGQSQPMILSLLGARMKNLSTPAQSFSVTARLKFSGAERMSVLAYGKTTQFNLQGDWPSPGFDGGFLPASRTVLTDGFKAQWSVPFIARGVIAQGPMAAITGLDKTGLGVSFVEVADPYQSVDRALKYVALLLGLVFLSYFVFEVTASKRVHIAQYVLVGVAQLIFYLLLLALAERIGFDFGFLLAGGATVALLSLNAAWVFASRLQGLRALGIFSMLYGLIYTLLRLEDNAMLVGALASFAAVAAAMYYTRSIDWYGTLQPQGDVRSSVVPHGPVGTV